MKRSFRVMDQIKAWSDGRAYDYPDYFKIYKGKRGWWLEFGRGSIIYKKEVLRTKKQAIKAVELLIERMKN